jgi:hypothetical protein
VIIVPRVIPPELSEEPDETQHITKKIFGAVCAFIGCPSAIPSLPLKEIPQPPFACFELNQAIGMFATVFTLTSDLNCNQRQHPRANIA